MMRFKVSRFPDGKFRRYGAAGFGIIFSTDKFKGISIVFAFWQLNIGNLSDEAMAGKAKPTSLPLPKHEHANDEKNIKESARYAGMVQFGRNRHRPLVDHSAAIVQSLKSDLSECIRGSRIANEETSES